LAKRIFEIAKELGIKSKAIVEKCKAEDVPSVNNHMSSVSAGLEATIREWFEAGKGGVATAIERSTHVDLEKVRAIPRRQARARARPKGEQPEHAPVAGAAGPVTLAPVGEAPVESSASGVSPAPKAAEGMATAPPDDAPEPTTQQSTEDEHAPSDEHSAATPQPERTEAQVVMNVPQRPKTITPAGPKLETLKPAQLSGPKVVRIEKPDALPARRARRPLDQPTIPHSRGPRAGGGVPGGPPADTEGRGKSSRRNKRRAGDTRTTRGKSPSPNAGEDSSKWRQQDLIEREERLMRAGGLLRQRRRDMKQKSQRIDGNRANSLSKTGGVVKIAAPFTIKELSATTGVKASEVIKKLFMQGVMATVNSGIDTESAQAIMLEFDILLEAVEAKSAEDVVVEQFDAREVTDQRLRNPIVTILGHVDHGKTSLLDRIRQATVAEGEAGGITQATSAFRVPVHVSDEQKQIVFLDTPGHEAFTAMRARGARVTDIVVLVVAADDGVMPQTIESISHSKAAGVPIIVALNKIDKAEATDPNIQKILGQLAEHKLNPTEWGGDTEVVRTSAATGEGVQDLLEAIDFQAQLKEFKADFGGAARGAVIESSLVEGRGSVANVLVQEGHLKVGDFIVAGRAFGRVRDITNDRGERIAEALPSDPVQISGLDETPDAGDKFYVVDSLKKAQDAAEQRRERDRERDLSQPRATLESILSDMKDSETKELLVIVKADVQGSVETLQKTISEIGSDEVRVRVLHTAVGGVSDSDVLLASASNAIITAFNVIPSASARRLAESKGVEIRAYQIIYDIIDDLKRAAETLLAPEIRQEVLGHAEVRKVFRVSKIGVVAGCYVTDGVVERSAMIRVTRGDVVIENDRVLEQLKRFKDDAKEVRSGQECGMKIEGYDDIKEGDILECYRKIEVKRTI